MNRGKFRQPGTVSQRFIEIRLIKGARHASNALTLSGALEADARAINAAIASLRNALPQLADDPHLLLPTTIGDSSRPGVMLATTYAGRSQSFEAFFKRMCA